MGKGITYVRKKDGREIGYATKDEYMKAKAQKNESYISLKNFIIEQLNK